MRTRWKSGFAAVCVYRRGRPVVDLWGGIGDARSLARLYAAAIGEVDGIRLLAPETIARAACEAVSGSDAVIFLPTRFGQGFMLPPTLSQACAEGSF